MNDREKAIARIVRSMLPDMEEDDEQAYEDDRRAWEALQAAAKAFREAHGRNAKYFHVWRCDDGSFAAQVADTEEELE